MPEEEHKVWTGQLDSHCCMFFKYVGLSGQGLHAHINGMVPLRIQSTVGRKGSLAFSVWGKYFDVFPRDN